MVLEQRYRQQGFGLIEAMVTISIFLLISLVALPLTSSWSNGAVLMATSSVLQQAYTRARVVAISNPDAVAVGAVSAWMCLSNGTVYVHRGSQTVCGAAPQLTTELKSGVAVSTTGAGAALFQCLALDSFGLPLSATINSAICSTTLGLQLSKGSTSNEVSLY